MTDADRQLLAEAVNRLESASVVIAHGTDTLTHTAEYLSRHASTATAKVVVLTGALQPAAMAVSDAALSLGAAVLASQTLKPGVYVCMSGHALPAGEARKDPKTGHFVRKAQPHTPGT